jgi:hypothetical protein
MIYFYIFISEPIEADLERPSTKPKTQKLDFGTEF